MLISWLYPPRRGLGAFVFVDIDVREVVAVVTTLTVWAEAAGMNVIAVMTRVAFLGKFEVLFHACGVAVMAVQFCVLANQFEFRLRVVVEDPEFPAIRVVAVCASGAQFSLVFVVGLVAGMAVRLCVLEVSRQMAFLAGRYRMDPDEREMRNVVIEHDTLVPRCIVMTLVTEFSLLFLVHVILFVAVEARGR